MSARLGREQRFKSISLFHLKSSAVFWMEETQGGSPVLGWVSGEDNSLGGAGTRNAAIGGGGTQQEHG